MVQTGSSLWAAQAEGEAAGTLWVPLRSRFKARGRHGGLRVPRSSPQRRDRRDLRRALHVRQPGKHIQEPTAEVPGCRLAMLST